MKKKILIISLSYLHKDPRVLRQYDVLKESYEVSTMGYSPISNEIPHTELVSNQSGRASKVLKLGAMLARRFNYLSKQELSSYKIDFDTKDSYDIIICNDVNSLPIGQAISKGEVPIWADLHEYSPRQFENFWWWNLLFKPYVHWQTNFFLPKCNAITTVCEGLAKEYKRVFQVELPLIVYNAPDYEDLTPSPLSEKIKLVHHGGATPHRKLENMVEMMRLLGDNYSLDFYLMANNSAMKKYESELKDLGKGLPISFNSPVGTKDLAKELNKFDIGLFFLEPVNFNYLNALPNKLFEFVQARLCIAISPNPEMKRMVEKYNLGVVSDDYDYKALADRIRNLKSDDIVKYKQSSHEHAQVLSSMSSSEVIKKIVKQLIN